MKITRKTGNLCEMRGITFVNEKNSGWKRYLFMSKFMNVNQTSGTSETLMKLSINNVDYGIVNINKTYQTNDGKTVRAIDLKIGQIVGEYEYKTDTVSELFLIETLEKVTFETKNKENSWMYEDLKDLEIVNIANKEDGSAIRFIEINGELKAKTKFSFEAEQAELAMSVVDNDSNLKEFIIETLENNLTALFELVSPLNKIVLSYNETDLKLLQLRDDETGKYLDVYSHPLVLKYDIRTTQHEPLELLKTVAEKYTVDEVRELVGDDKFNSLTEFLEYLDFCKMESVES